MDTPSEDYVARPAPLPGYRQLTQHEIDMVNAWKDLERQAAQLYAATHEFDGTDHTDLYVARDHFKTAFMWAVRSVARPRDVFADELAEAVADRIDVS